MSLQIKIQDPSIFDQYDPGDKVYLVEWFNELNPSKNYYISSEIPRTNSSREPREKGWLGCTDNINKTSKGLFEIEELELIVKPIPDPYYAKQGFTETVGVKVKLTEV